MDKVFKGIKVYYSGSMQGVQEQDLDFPKKLVDFMQDCGANVLSYHVALGKEEGNKLLFQQIKIDPKKTSIEKISKIIRRQDISWVDEADCMVALVNSPSLGVGMELQRALDKEKLGMKKTPILCLVRADLKDKLSFMVSGINIKESDVFYLRSYKDLDEAKKHISDFFDTFLSKNSRRISQKMTRKKKSGTRLAY
jgi:hypothetical protein